MNDFNLRNFLTENKLTSNSRVLKELELGSGQGAEMAKHIKWLEDNDALVLYNGRQYTITFFDEATLDGDTLYDSRLYFVFTTDELPDLAFTTILSYVPEEQRHMIDDDDISHWEVKPIDEAMKWL